MKSKGTTGSSFDSHIAALKKRDPEFRKALEREFANLPVSTQIAIARRESGMTQEAVAKKLRISQSAIAQIERADGNPTVQTVRRIASVLGYELTLRKAS